MPARPISSSCARSFESSEPAPGYVRGAVECTHLHRAASAAAALAPHPHGRRGLRYVNRRGRSSSAGRKILAVLETRAPMRATEADTWAIVGTAESRGFLRRQHGACAERHARAKQTIQDLCVTAALRGDGLDTLPANLRETASAGFIDMSDATLTETWRTAGAMRSRRPWKTA